MYKPLSLYSPQQGNQKVSISKASSIYKYADSLAFSHSEDRNISNKSSFFGEDKHQKLSKQLQSLQIKLEDLEGQIMPITLQANQQNNKTLKYQNKLDHIATAEYFRKKKLYSQGKQNRLTGNNNSGVGKIVKRKQILSNDKLTRTLNKNNQDLIVNFSKNSLITDTSQILQKSKEVIKLKKQIQIIRTSLEKSQKSMSQCSQKLSASKSIIRSLKLQERKNEKNMQKLKQQLKKSENIRQKQKKIILNQKKQLQKCRQILKKINKPY